MHTTATSSVSLARLRRLMPVRSISYRDALAIAERQANLLVSAWGYGKRAVRETDVQSLTTLAIVRDKLPAGCSGSSRYLAGGWLVLLQESDSRVRQRFTLAHELKHIIDAGADIETAYSYLTDRQIERVCDYFAACLLMSKRLMYRLWGSGLRTPEALADAANVSLRAMLIRLDTLGLPINHAEAGASICRHPSRSARVPALRLQPREEQPA